VRQRQEAEEREALERRWYPRTSRRPELAREVTAEDAREEPFHRWLPYRQGFAPALVRRFLQDEGIHEDRACAPVVLDPFSGSGTTVIECGRRGVRAVGVEAIPGLVAVTQAAFAAGPPPALPELPEGAGTDQVCAALRTPAHVAAYLAARAPETRGDGVKRPRLAPFRERMERAFRRMHEDLLQPLSKRGAALVGDARALPLRDGSVDAVLTSPPYISRFDYTRIAGPLAEALGVTVGRGGQVRAARSIRRRGGRVHGQGRGRGRNREPRESPDEARQPSPETAHRAATEACERLTEDGKTRSSALVARYTDDMRAFVRELARVCRAGAPAWVVIGGAFVEDVYVPADLIVAELAERAGFEVEAIDVARNLAQTTGRRLGGLERVAPRESVLRMRRKA
jgi:hypothetical protein